MRSAFPVGGWFAVACLVGSAVWACSGSDTNPFGKSSRGGQSSTGGTDTGGGGTSGSSSGSATGGSPTGGTSGSSSGGDGTGGTPTGGATGDGGAAAESGTDSGGSTTGGMGGAGLTAGAGGAGMSGNAGTPAIGGAGMSGAGMGGAGVGVGGAGAGGGGKSGSGGGPSSGCKVDGDCNGNQYCMKESCAAEDGACQPRGPECRGTNAAFDPVCGCDGITYYNTCVIEHEGFNVAAKGECTGNSRPTCTRDEGGASCPTRLHAHCYRPVDMCGDPSPTMGVCWVLPDECPSERATQRYCGGTAGSARCIGLCEVVDAENSFRRDSPTCAATTQN